MVGDGLHISTGMLDSMAHFSFLLTIFSGQSTCGTFVAGLADDGARTRRTGTAGGASSFTVAACCSSLATDDCDGREI